MPGPAWLTMEDDAPAPQGGPAWLSMSDEPAGRVTELPVTEIQGDPSAAPDPAIERMMVGGKDGPKDVTAEAAPMRERARRRERMLRMARDPIYRLGEMALPTEEAQTIVGRDRRGEALLRGAADMATMGFGDEAAAGLRSLGGEDYEAARDRIRGQQAEAQAQAPVRFAAGQAAAVVPQAVALPSAARSGAALASRLGLGGAGRLIGGTAGAAAEGAALGGLHGAGTSEADDAGGVAGDVASGAGMGALTGGALHGAAGLVGAAGRGAVNLGRGAMARYAGLARGQEVGRIARELLEPGAEGAARRASATQFEGQADDFTRELSERVSENSAIADRIENDLSLALKPDAVQRAMGEAPPAADATLAAARTIEDIETGLTNIIENESRGYERSGIGRMTEVRDRIAEVSDALRTNEDPAQAFIELDRLKRSIGRARRRTGGDTGAQEVIEGAYERVRQELLNRDRWGQGAVDMQGAINEAYTEAIPRGRAMERRFMSEQGERAANGWDDLPEGDAGSIQGLLGQLHRPAGEQGRRILERGVESQARLGDVLQRYYAPGGSMRGDAVVLGRNANRIRSMLETAGEGATRASELGELSQLPGLNIAGVPVLPSPATTVRGLAAVERAGIPGRVRALTGPAQRTGAAARRLAAVTSGRSQVERAHQDPQHFSRMQTDPDYRRRVREMAGETTHEQGRHR